MINNTFTIHDMREECRKEVDARCRTYAKLVERGFMSRMTADHRIAIMEAIVDLIDRVIADGEKQAAYHRERNH